MTNDKFKHGTIGFVSDGLAQNSWSTCHQLGGPDYPYLWWVCTGPRNPLSTKSTALGSCASGSRLSLKIRYTFYSTCFAKKIMIIHWVLGCPIFRLCTYWLYDRCDAKKNLSQLEMTNPGFIAAWNCLLPAGSCPIPTWPLATLVRCRIGRSWNCSRALTFFDLVAWKSES